MTEKVIEVKPLSNSFTIDLLFKKSLKEISNAEIEELLKLKPPKKVLFSQPQTENKYFKSNLT